MRACPLNVSCPFYSAVEPSFVKRVRFGAARRYCRGGLQESCALHPYVARGDAVPVGLLPSGGRGEYLTGGKMLVRVLVVDNSPIFSMIAANAVTYHMPQAEVITCDSYDEAERQLASAHFEALVCGYGLGGGKTAHDLRRVSRVPMVVLTGRPEDQIEAPENCRIVQKGTGPEGLRAAIGASLAR
ncbi:MAG TPA: hypothetical protein VLA05_07585 [Coriobacteriia bacterium]|nr:hypothetical protein [Coriobacteriia bacterium]